MPKKCARARNDDTNEKCITELLQALTRWKAQYGDVFTAYLPNPTIIIASKEALHEAYDAQGDAFAGRPDFQVERTMRRLSNRKWRGGVALCRSVLILPTYGSQGMDT